MGLRGPTLRAMAEERLLLLIPTTSYRAEDFLAAAERMGVAVTVGSDQTSVLAGFDPAGTLEVPFADPDAAVERIADFHQRFPLAAIVGVDEGTTGIAARASHRLGLPHNDPDAVAIAGDKARFRECLSDAGLPQPVARVFSVIRADDAEEFAAAFERIRRILAETNPDTGLRAQPHVLAEEYLDGGEVALEGLLVDGALHVLALFDKPEPMRGPTFEETIFTTPSRLPEATQAAIVARTRAAIAAVGLRDGPVHAELRLTEEHGPVPLEIAARSIGGLCGRVLRYGAGLSLEELVLARALGRDPGELTRTGRPAGVMMLPVPRAGRLVAVEGQAAARAVEGIVDLRITVAPGTYIRPLPEGDRYLGFLFARADDPERVQRALTKAASRLRVEINGAGSQDDAGPHHDAAATAWAGSKPGS